MSNVGSCSLISEATVIISKETGGGEGSELKLPEKFCLKNMLMIRLTINTLPLVFTYFILSLRNKKKYHCDFSVTFLCKTISTHWYTNN